MDIDNVRHGRFATILDLNSLDISNDKIRKEVLANAKEKQYIVTLGNLALIETRLRQQFQMQPNQAKLQIKQVKSFVKELAEVQSNGGLYYILEATPKQAAGFNAKTPVASGRRI